MTKKLIDLKVCTFLCIDRISFCHVALFGWEWLNYKKYNQLYFGCNVEQTERQSFFVITVWNHRPNGISVIRSIHDHGSRSPDFIILRNMANLFSKVHVKLKWPDNLVSPDHWALNASTVKWVKSLPKFPLECVELIRESLEPERGIGCLFIKSHYI